MGFCTFDDDTVGPNFKPSLYVEMLPELMATAGFFSCVGALVLLRRLRARRERAWPTRS